MACNGKPGNEIGIKDFTVELNLGDLLLESKTELESKIQDSLNT